MSAARFDGMELGPALDAVFGCRPEPAELIKLKGDASTRRYYRLRAPSGSPRSLVVMRLPDEPQPDELPFVNVQRLLDGRGIRVPRILHEDRSRGLLLLEDLGDETFEARLAATPRECWEALYEQAISLLARMHAACERGQPHELPYGRGFDRALFSFELEHFRKWGLEALTGPLTAAERGVVDNAFSWLCDHLLELPRGFVHRDYQSRNLMWHEGELVVIDFQDALLGPRVYDLVALLCDSYVWLDRDMVRRQVAAYARLAHLPLAATERAFWWVAVQRKLKDAGRFVFIDQVRGNPDFLRWYGPSLRQVGRALAEIPELEPLRRLLTDKLAGFPDAVAEPAPQTGVRPGQAM